jgi:hypothetical protein
MLGSRIQVLGVTLLGFKVVDLGLGWYIGV